MSKINRQKQLFEGLHSKYQAHYFDESSMRYRERFIYGPLFAGLDLNDSLVADLACAGGQNTLALRDLFPRVRAVGIDISKKAVLEYRQTTGWAGHVMDLTLPNLAPLTVDVAIVIGGLHHCVADLPQTLLNIASMVRPGGHLLMLEPNSRYALESLRRVWYRFDQQVDALSEHALDHSEIAEQAKPYFDPVQVNYLGGPAYFLILNSMMTRVPLSLKPLLAPPLFYLESLHTRIPYRWAHSLFAAQWRRTEIPVSDDASSEGSQKFDVNPNPKQIRVRAKGLLAQCGHLSA